MFWFGLFLLFVVISSILVALGAFWLKRNSGGDGDGWYCVACLTFVVSLIFLICSVGSTMSQIADQTRDITTLKMYDANAAIYKQKADALTQQFAHYLADVYPEHEKNIFKSISPEKVSIYVVKYPDLQASKTIITLVDQIEKLNSDFYDQQLLKQKVLMEIRYRTQNPWSFNSFVPEYKEK